MKVITEHDMDIALTKVEAGLKKYCWIQDRFWKRSVDCDQEFQRRFNDFYKVRRNLKWRKIFYNLLEKAKVQSHSFPEVLIQIREKTDRLEASFVSKLIATLNPEKPIIDKFVLTNFNLALPYHYESNRESKIIQVYDDLCRKYDDFMAHEIAKVICDKFRRKYPWAHITDIKRVDLVLWQIR